MEFFIERGKTAAVAANAIHCILPSYTIFFCSHNRSERCEAYRTRFIDCLEPAPSVCMGA